MGASESTAESVRAQTDRVLGSSHFARSPTLSRPLRFVVEATLDVKEQELKEYRLGVDVFGRGSDFDPRVDPIVQMQAAKLRARLAEYYGTDGRGDAIVISIPNSAYIPAFARVGSSNSAPPPTTGSHDVQSIAVLPFVRMSGDLC